MPKSLVVHIANLAHLRLAGTSQFRTSLLGVWMDTATWAADLLQSSLSWGISPTVDTVSCRHRIVSSSQVGSTSHKYLVMPCMAWPVKAAGVM